MKKVLLIPLILLLAACTQEPQIVYITATPLPPTETPLPTDTPLPTNTPTPTNTPMPTLEPYDVAEVDAALRANGYRRYPLTTEDGIDGFSWARDNDYERIITWETGVIELSILHDRSAHIRGEHMEAHFAVLDQVFPAALMEELRAQNDIYNSVVGPDVSGEPDNVYAAGGEWQIVWAEYNVFMTDISGYTLRYSLWWWQSTCPPQYMYCSYTNFPGLEFTGDSSFVFYTILIHPRDPGRRTSPST